jgi:hypothetical protein
MPGLIVAGPMLWFLTRYYASTAGDRPIDLARTSAALTILLSRPEEVGELRKRGAIISLAPGTHVKLFDLGGSVFTEHGLQAPEPGNAGVMISSVRVIGGKYWGVRGYTRSSDLRLPSLWPFSVPRAP